MFAVVGGEVEHAIQHGSRRVGAAAFEAALVASVDVLDESRAAGGGVRRPQFISRLAVAGGEQECAAEEGHRPVGSGPERLVFFSDGANLRGSGSIHLPDFPGTGQHEEVVTDGRQLIQKRTRDAGDRHRPLIGIRPP